jgi:uncharacterized membrane protein YphA (DoxX/SURF4 family)
MNILLWVVQGLAALLYTASGTMKIFMFEKISADVRSFDALPRSVWKALGILELVCVAGLIVPAVFHWYPRLTVVAAALLAIESLVFVWVHVEVPGDPAPGHERRARPPDGVPRLWSGVFVPALLTSAQEFEPRITRITRMGDSAFPLSLPKPWARI